MTDTIDPAAPAAGDGEGGGRVEPVDIQQEMQRSYIDYAMSVIVGRALPLVEDGLKPVHRRVLYSMVENGFRPDRSFVKCARVVGDVMGNYHPHGDSSIYDTLVRLAQPWSMRMPLIDSQGNLSCYWISNSKRMTPPTTIVWVNSGLLHSANIFIC